jgi:hypothetical protein
MKTINLSNLYGGNGFRLDGVAEYNFSGRSVSDAGDVNGDGFDDVIVGASGADLNGSHSGSSYVVFGKASGFSAHFDLSTIDGGNGFRLDGVAEGDSLGGSVSNAGDVNGDGFDDVIVGANGADSNGNNSGSSYVVFGKASGFSATMDLSSLDGSSGFRLDGVPQNYSGGSVSNAGDVNGDGFDDLIVGAVGADPNGSFSGSSYVVFGKASGFSATMDLSSLNGSNGFRLDGVAEDDFSGRSVSNAGDVNGDGFDDVIVGVAFANPNGDSSGSSYVVFGKASGFSATMELFSLDGSNGFRLDGVATFDHSGWSVSSAGDVNGDGLDDLIVGASRAAPNGFDSGSSYVVFGKVSGFSATMDLSSLDGSNGFRLDGVAAFDFSGESVGNAGDVNGDGFDDLIVGASGANPNGTYSGSSYVVFGKASGFSATMDLSSLDDSNGFRLDGVERESSGSSVSSAGDVNGDGFDDLIVSAPDADPNGERSGSSYIIFGRSDFGSDVDFPGTDGDDELTGTQAAERFEAGAGNDKMIGRGGADVFFGEAGDDYIRVGDLNFQWVDGGVGSDTLGLDGKDLNLDLTGANGRIDGIETINLNGTGDNTLTLTVLDVVNLSDTSNVLRVDGNEGDRIVGLSSGWRDSGVHGEFHTYTQGEAMLQVGVDVATDFPNTAIATHIDLDSLDGSNGFRIEGLPVNTYLDTVSNAGDVNGDGYDDVMLGVHMIYDPFYIDPLYPNDTGFNYVAFGKPDGGFSATFDVSDLDGENGFYTRALSHYGVVSGAGDINGDGFDDMVFGAPYSGIDGDYSSSYVVFGSPEKFDAKFSFSNLNGSNGFQLRGGWDVGLTGSSVSTAGDINGDGFDDLIVSGIKDTNSREATGYVVFGKASGFSASFGLSSLDGSNGFRLDGGLDVDMSRFTLNLFDAVSNAGDVNGDGFDDLIVGGEKIDTNGEKHTVSYVVFGKASGFSATMDLSSLDGSNGFRLNVEEGYSLRSVSNAGDVNGDGFDDLIVGGSGADSNGDNSGSSYVVFGKASGFSATMDLSSLDGSNGFRLDGVAAGDVSGHSVSTAGDVNGDGFDDLIIGAPGADPSGSSYVVFGKASGFSAHFDLSTINDNNGFILNGVAAGEFSGLEVSSAGDVNGDGFDDLIVGGRAIIPGGSYKDFYHTGLSYVVFGGDFGSDVDFPGTAGNDELTGTKVAESFEAGAGNDKMIGRGGADVFYGEAGDDYIRVGDLNFQLVDGGTGRDTLGLGGKDLNLDLADASDRINDIETIYLYGTGDNTLTLTALDVANLSSTSNVLKVNGNEGDRIVGLSSGWNDGGVQGKFHYYTYRGEEVLEAVVLLVGLDVATDFPVI